MLLQPMNAPSPFISVRIRDIHTETNQAKTFYLETTDGTPLVYKAGQFITFVFPRQDRPENRRSYSYSTAPGIDPIPAITLKRVPNGEYSRWFIDHAKVGDTLLSIGSAGYFTLPEDLKSYRQLFLIAAGSGITPVFSLLKDVLKNHPELPVVLIYSNRNTLSTIFYKELKALEEKYAGRLTIEFLFSSSADLTRARLGKWLLEVLLKKYAVSPFDQTLYYLCGPYDYMRMASIVLQTEGVPPENIRKENFAIVRPKQREEPSDKDPHLVEVRMNGEVYRFTTQYPETILQQAKKSGIQIPYSCESGQCGTCAATCVAGKVWMWNNEVLVDSEVAKGRVLTCTGFPVGGDVILEIP